MVLPSVGQFGTANMYIFHDKRTYGVFCYSQYPCDLLFTRITLMLISKDQMVH